MPEQTAEKFISHAEFGRLYRTGGKCRIDSTTGQADFLGRIDTQLKVRGHRVEVQAVEDILQTQIREIEAAVLDLRCLAPLDRETLLLAARHCGKVLIAQEDSRTGGIGESLAAIIQEHAFEDLDGPLRIVGALDTPVPYAPPLEDRFLANVDRIERAARLLAAY